MAATVSAENVIQIGDTIRVEPGPVKITAEATPELLSNEVTADHYALPQTATPDEIADPAVLTVDGMRTSFDADGNPIVLGQPMAYLDWNGHTLQREGATGFYVYQLDTLTAAERKERGITDAQLEAMGEDRAAEVTQIWREISCEPDLSAALSRAFELAKGA